MPSSDRVCAAMAVVQTVKAVSRSARSRAGRSVISANDPARRPQSLVLSALLVVVAVLLVRQGLTGISLGEGGFVPYLVIIGGPSLAIYYIWYFNFRRFGSDD